MSSPRPSKALIEVTTNENAALVEGLASRQRNSCLTPCLTATWIPIGRGAPTRIFFRFFLARHSLGRRCGRRRRRAFAKTKTVTIKLTAILLH